MFDLHLDKKWKTFLAKFGNLLTNSTLKFSELIEFGKFRPRFRFFAHGEPDLILPLRSGRQARARKSDELD